MKSLIPLISVSTSKLEIRTWRHCVTSIFLIEKWIRVICKLKLFPSDLWGLSKGKHFSALNFLEETNK